MCVQDGRRLDAGCIAQLLIFRLFKALHVFDDLWPARMMIAIDVAMGIAEGDDRAYLEHV